MCIETHHISSFVYISITLVRCRHLKRFFEHLKIFLGLNPASFMHFLYLLQHYWLNVDIYLLYIYNIFIYYIFSIFCSFLKYYEALPGNSRIHELSFQRFSIFTSSLFLIFTNQERHDFHEFAKTEAIYFDDMMLTKIPRKALVSLAINMIKIVILADRIHFRDCP